MGTGIYYRHSGAVGLIGPLVMSFVGAIAALALGIAYGLADWYSPLIYVNFLLTCALGFGVGFAVGHAAKWMNVRNTMVTMAIAFLFGAVAVYVAWIAWIAALTKYEVLVWEPGELWAIADFASTNGVWSIKNHTPTGWQLWTVWAIEAALIVGIAAYSPKFVLGTTPFCERCERWVSDSQLYGPLGYVPLAKELRAELEQGSFDSLKKLHRLDRGDRFCEVELTACPTCTELRLVTVRNVVIGVDKEGKPTRNDQNIVLHLMLNDRQHAELTRHMEDLPAPPEEPPIGTPSDAPDGPDELPKIKD
jgi:hypothetical protein